MSFDVALASDDPCKQGIEVFDMMNQQWLDEFKADGVSYEKPAVIASRVATMTTQSSWADDQLRQAFQRINTSRLTGPEGGAVVGGVGSIATICLVLS